MLWAWKMAVPCVRRAKDTLTGFITLLLHQHNQLSYSFSFHRLGCIEIVYVIVWRILVCTEFRCIDLLEFYCLWRFMHWQSSKMLLAICQKKRAIFASNGNYFRPCKSLSADPCAHVDLVCWLASAIYQTDGVAARYHVWEKAQQPHVPTSHPMACGFLLISASLTVHRPGAVYYSHAFANPWTPVLPPVRGSMANPESQWR